MSAALGSFSSSTKLAFKSIPLSLISGINLYSAKGDQIETISDGSLFIENLYNLHLKMDAEQLKAASSFGYFGVDDSVIVSPYTNQPINIPTRNSLLTTASPPQFNQSLARRVQRLQRYYNSSTNSYQLTVEKRVYQFRKPQLYQQNYTSAGTYPTAGINGGTMIQASYGGSIGNWQLAQGVVCPQNVVLYALS